MSRSDGHTAVHTATKILLALVLLIFALRTWMILDHQPGTVTLPPRATVPAQPLPEAEYLVKDDRAGHRPRANHQASFRSAVLGRDVEAEVTRRQGRLGLIRPEALADDLPVPRILMVGDLNLMGVVPTEQNLSHLLETQLRQDPAWADSLVLNAGCAGYGPYQDALRAASLAPLLDPQVLVAFISMGNDFLDLEDRHRPHLDDSLFSQPAQAKTATDTNTNRQAMLGLTNAGAFWQGMNQASWLDMSREQTPKLEAKFLFCLGMLAKTANQCGASLLLVLLPSSDLVLADLVASEGRPYAMKLAAKRVQADWYSRICELLTKQGYAFEDLRNCFQSYGRPDLYAQDHHLAATGHRLVAEAIGPRIRRLLTSRSRFR